MSVFSDEQLVRLKKDIVTVERTGDCVHMLVLPMKALVERLEAAEKCIKHLQHICGFGCAEADFEAWRKMAGK
jgi:hypothetical protein